MALIKTPEKKTWTEFRESGLLLFVNTFLHIFGWVIVIEMDDDGNESAYPARTSWRGLPEDAMDRAYKRVTKTMEANLPQLLEDTKD